MPYKVFLCHAREDHELVKAIHDTLSQLDGVECYVAEYRSEPDKYVTDKIEGHIHTSDAMLVLLTEAAKKSEFAQQEVGWARREFGNEKPIVVFSEAGVKPGGFLYGHDSIEFIQADFDERLSELGGHIRRLSQDREQVLQFYPEETKRRIRDRTMYLEHTFTIQELRDQSTALVKRYSANIIVEGKYDLESIGPVVREATDHVRNLDYHRNAKVSERWAAEKAGVVWLFVYASVEDIVSANWICRTVWVSPDLPRDSRPLMFDPDAEFQSILINWNEDYDTLRSFYQAKTLSKGAYIRQMDSISREAANLVDEGAAVLDSLGPKAFEDDETLARMAPDAEKFRRLYLAAGKLGFPPAECAAVDVAFQSFMGHGDNLYLFFSPSTEAVWKTEARFYLSKQSAIAAKEEMQRLRALRERL